MHETGPPSTGATFQLPTLPLQFRAMNAVGAVGRSLGLPLARLDEQSILGQGIRESGGLDDFGEGPFLEPMRILIESLERDAGLTFVGRNAARRSMVEAVRNRLRLVDDRKRHPEIADVEVMPLLVIVGGPRTGSTILHDLLASDPRSRCPRGWESQEPSPPPGLATEQPDPRIARCEAYFARIDKMIPDFRKMHALDANSAQECVVLTSNSMVSANYHAQYHVPDYYAYLEDGLDWKGVMEFHKRQLQHLQWRMPGEHWVLKTGQHNLSMAELLETYPNANIICTHRDPVKIATSFASVSTQLRSMGSKRVVPTEMGPLWCPRLNFMYERAMDVRESGEFPENRFYDMHFQDLVKDWRGVVERIYDRFGLELRDDALDAMAKFMDANKQGKYGIHNPTPDQFGIDVPTERVRYRRYMERFGIQTT